MTAPVDELVIAGDTLYFAGRLVRDHRFTHYQHWLLPAQGWVVGRFVARRGARPMGEDWYVDLDSITVTGDVWRVEDRLLDVSIHEGRRYDVQDADELADCLAAGTIAPAEAIAALRSLDALCRALERLQFSGAALLAEFAPGLPVPELGNPSPGPVSPLPNLPAHGMIMQSEAAGDQKWAAAHFFVGLRHARGWPPEVHAGDEERLSDRPYPARGGEELAARDRVRCRRGGAGLRV